VIVIAAVVAGTLAAAYLRHEHSVSAGRSVEASVNEKAVESPTARDTVEALQDRQESTQQILIQYRHSLSATEKERIREQASVLLVREANTPFVQMDIVTPKTAGAVATRKALTALSRSPEVQIAEVNATYGHEPNPH
jgi:hypothetical protein